MDSIIVVILVKHYHEYISILRLWSSELVIYKYPANIWSETFRKSNRENTSNGVFFG